MRGSRIVLGLAVVLALALVIVQSRSADAQTPGCSISATVGNSPAFESPIVSAVDARLVCPHPVSGGWMTVIWRAGGRTSVCSVPVSGDTASCQAAIPAVGEEMGITILFESGGQVYQHTFTAPGDVRQGGTYIRSAPPRRDGRIRLSHVYPVGIGGTQPDEWIQFENLEEFPVDMTGWVLKTQAKNQTYIFGPFVIGPGGRCRIYTNTNDSTWCDLTWSSGWEIWSDVRDTGVLFNYLGDEKSRISYQRNEDGSFNFQLEWRWIETTTVTIPGSQFGAASTQSSSSSSTTSGGPTTSSGSTTPSGSTGNPGGSTLLNLPF